MALEVTDATFAAEVLQSDVPVLVDFWSQGCGPCLRMAPVIDELAKDNEGKAKVVKANIENAMEIAGQYQITMLPTLLVFKGGQVIDQTIGAQDKASLQAMIDEAIG